MRRKINRENSIRFDDPDYRQSQWRLWWETKGKFKKQKILIPKKVNLPERSTLLAEFVGIMLGDGGIQKYQIVITLHRNELPYARYVSQLIKTLFNLKPSMSAKGANAINLTISRINVVKFCLSIGLCLGNKLRNNCTVPEWIMQSEDFQTACLRGLIDTDGSIFQEKHKINSRVYQYPRLNFTSFSPSLITSAYTIFISKGFRAKIRRKHKSVQLENKSDICHYFKTISTRNSRHLNRYAEFCS